MHTPYTPPTHTRTHTHRYIQTQERTLKKGLYIPSVSYLYPCFFFFFFSFFLMRYSLALFT